ncbi:MAG: endoribonuclease [Herbaspirillum sp.]|jgi:enamine deaminase RidA (YjgF/YER057c/UK114 family)|nr:endoribonuclease [Herbaspirillum sp.]
MSIVRHKSNKFLSGAVEANGMVYVAGMTADTLPASVTVQTTEVLAKIDALLAAAGSNKSKIVSATIWVTDIRFRDEMNEVWIAWADPANLPARACITAQLNNPLMSVEIAVIAVK